MKRRFLSSLCAVASVVAVCALSGKPAHANAWSSVTQQYTMYSSGLSTSGQWNFSLLTFTRSAGGGFGEYILPLNIGAYSVWYGIVILDYTTGSYEEITYVRAHSL